jgi:hypothetical protein
MQDILMGINNGSQVDLTVIDVLLQYRNDSVTCQFRFLMFLKCEYILFWVSGVDYYGVLRVVVNYEVGVVITTSHPYGLDQQCRKVAQRKRLYLKVGLTKDNLHMGIDRICMARASGGNRSFRRGLVS